MDEKMEAEDHSPAVRGLFLSHSQLMVASRLVEAGLQLLLNQFDRGFIRRGVAIAEVARSVPAILHIDCSGKDFGLSTQINAYTINFMAYDPAKRKKNRRKHEIDLAECEPVFDEPMLTREDVREEYGEQRLVSLGWLNGRVVVLIWTDREDGPRMISCREAERHEQEAYFREYPQV